jgi:hypothetical protein
VCPRQGRGGASAVNGGVWRLAFVFYDFCYYWNHRIGHERNIFWASHVVHHQSEDYNLSTALRQTSTGFLLSWVFYLPLAVLGVPLLVFYCTYGDILSNLIWCGLMIWLSFCAARGLFYANTRTGEARNRRYFHVGVLCYVGSEYLLWTVGCFWSATSPASPAFWCDLLLTFALLGLLPAVRKAVEL